MVDDLSNIYILSQETTNERDFARLRKLNADGEEIFSFRLTIEAGKDSHAKDILLTSEGTLLCLFVKEQSGSVTNGEEDLVIQKFDLSGNLLSEFSEMVDPLFSAWISSIRFGELPDGGFVIQGPALSSMGVGSREMVVAKFDADFNLIGSMSTGLTSIRQRCFAIIDDDLILTGSPATSGPKIQLLALADSSVVWEQTLDVAGITSNFIYAPVILPNGNGYGIVANIHSSIDSLAGIWYFNLDVDGNIQSQTVFRSPIFNFNSGAFPSIVLDYQNRINVLFSAFDADTVGVTRHLMISESGEIECENLLDLGVGREQMRRYVNINTGQLLGVGSARDSSDMTSVVLLAAVDVDKIIDGVSPDHRLNELDFKVYPNPVTSGLINLSFINSPESAAVYELHAMNGTLIRSRIVTITENATLQIPVEDLTAGSYILSLKTNQGLGARKIVVR